MNDTEKNRLICKRLGIPHLNTWHWEEDDKTGFRREYDYPNFSTPDGIHLLLGEMMKRDDGLEFVLSIGTFTFDFIPYILITGKFADAALDFLAQEEIKI